MGGLGVNTQVASARMDDMDLQQFKTEMAGLKERMTGKVGREAKLRKACQNFEAVFITKLWQQMKQTVPKDGLMHSQQEDMYLSMFDRDFSEQMAASGGIGLADMLYDQLSQKLKDSSRDTLGGTVKPFNEPAPPIALHKDEPHKLEPTLEQWTGQESADVPTPERIVGGLLGSDPSTMSEAEVEARLNDLTRRLESQVESESEPRTASGENAPDARARNYGEDRQHHVGRNIAKIG